MEPFGIEKWCIYTLPEVSTASLHLKTGPFAQKERIVFQPSIFRCELLVSERVYHILWLLCQFAIFRSLKICWLKSECIQNGVIHNATPNNTESYWRCSNQNYHLTKLTCREQELTFPNPNIAAEKMPSQKENNLPIINFQVLCYFRESTALRCFQSAIASTSNPSSAHHMYHISLEHWKPNPPVTIDETTGWATRSHINGLLKKHVYISIFQSPYLSIQLSITLSI